MKTAQEVDAIMAKIPLQWRYRWCGGEGGPCACMGCVQIGNRAVMAKEFTGHDYQGDPEYIRETSIPLNIVEKFKVTKQEWQEWMWRNSKTTEITK